MDCVEETSEDRVSTSSGEHLEDKEWHWQKTQNSGGNQ